MRDYIRNSTVGATAFGEDPTMEGDLFFSLNLVFLALILSQKSP